MKKWKPKLGEITWYIDTTDTNPMRWTVHRCLWSENIFFPDLNVFPTKKAATAVLKRLKAVFKESK